MPKQCNVTSLWNVKHGINEYLDVENYHILGLQRFAVKLRSHDFGWKDKIQPFGSMGYKTVAS